MNKVSQTIVYGIIAAVVLASLWLIEDRRPIAPHGIFLPANETVLPAKSVNDIKVLKDIPATAHTIGSINVMMRFTEISHESEHQVLDYAIQLAADRGADALVLQSFFATEGEGAKSYVLRAQAVKN